MPFGKSSINIGRISVVVRSSLKCFIIGFLFFFLVTIPLETIACPQESCVGIDNYTSRQQEAWWITGATLRDYLRHKSLASQIKQGQKSHLKKDDLFPIKGHVIGDGRGDVLVYRNVFEGWSWMSDSGDFTQITIVIPKHLAGSGEILIGGPSGAIMFYTGGIPSFRSYCFGYATKGKIIYSTNTTNPDDINNLLFSKLGIQSGVWTKIDVQFILTNSDDGNQECRKCGFNANLIFQPRNSSFVNQQIEKYLKE